MNKLFVVRIAPGQRQTYVIPIEKIEFEDEIIEHKHYFEIGRGTYAKGNDEWKNYFKTEAEALAFKNSVIQDDINYYQNIINKLRGLLVV